MKKHNGIISFWKFIFCMVVLLHHFAIDVKWKYFKIGYLGVEFFFVVSGYLMAKSALKVSESDKQDLGENTWRYIWKKVKAIFPYVFMAYVTAIFVRSTFIDYKKYQYINSIWNLLLVDMSGIATAYMISQEWYISAMLISMMILYPLIKKYKKNFIYIIAPVVVLLVGGYISHTYGKLDGAWVWTGIMYKGLLRAFFELCLGTIAFEVTEKIKKINFSLMGRVILTVIEILGFFAVLIVITFSKSTNYDFIALALITISIIMAFSEKTFFYKFASNKFLYYLEKLSLPIYLNHLWAKNIFVNFFSHWSIHGRLASIIALTISVSVIELFIIEKSRGKMGVLLKNIFIETEQN